MDLFRSRTNDVIFLGRTKVMGRMLLQGFTTHFNREGK